MKQDLTAISVSSLQLSLYSSTMLFTVSNHLAADQGV